MGSNQFRKNSFLLYIHIAIETIIFFALKHPLPTDKISRFMCNESGHKFA